MRAYMPLNGLVKAKGAIVIHLAMLMASFFVYPSPPSSAIGNTPISTPESTDTKHTQPVQILFFLRVMHGFFVSSHIARVYTHSEENDLIHMLVKALEIWGYLMIMCFLQWYLMIQKADDDTDNSNETIRSKYIKTWIAFEVFVFYGRIFNTVLFLFYIQMRGVFGYKDNVENEDRFKYDALDYYEQDIDWLGFQALPIFQMANFLWRVNVQDDLSIDLTAKYMLSMLIGQRFLQFIMMSPFRTQDKFIQSHSTIKWLVLIIIECCALQLFFMQTSINPATPIFIFDLCLLVLQFLYHRECIREQEGMPPTFWCFLLPFKYQIADETITIEGNKAIENNHRLNFERLKKAKAMEPTDSNDNKLDEPSVNNDIYMLAFAAQLNPNEIEPGDDYIGKVQLINQERSDLFICALKVAVIQATSGILIVLFFIHGNDGKGFHFTTPDTFFVLLSRLVSSFMMHLNVMDDIDQGIAMMKYAVNQPYMFALQGEDKQYKGMRRRVFMAWFLGFCQAMIGIIIEALIIYYFSCLTSFIKICTQYVALAAIMKFDNFYSKCLYDHGIKASQGKNLRIYHKRFMLFLSPEELEKDCPLPEQHKKYINARKDNCFLKILRFIQKSMRIYYCSFYFYFVPISSILLNFLYTTQ